MYQFCTRRGHVCGSCGCTPRGEAPAATGWGGRMGAVQRIRVCATVVDVTPGVISGLLTELRPHLEDATVVKCALKALLTLVMERGHYQLVFDAGALDLVARALDIHGADSRMTLDALEVIGHVAVNLSDAALLTSADSLSDIVRVVVAAMHIQRADLTVFWACCDALFLLCDKSRVGKMNVSSDVAEQLVEVLHHALSDRFNDFGPHKFKVLRMLQSMTINPTVAGCANAAGCIELVIAALHHADIETSDWVHAYGCRALSQLCVGYELERIDACGFVEVAFESLRLFPDCHQTQGGGLSMLLVYRVRLNGCALDVDLFGPDAVQAALHAMRLGCQKINSVGIEVGDLGTSMVALMHLALKLLTSLNDTRPSSWLFPLLNEPETAELLKRSLRWLDRVGETHETLAVFVQRMTQGACCGCGELQDTKMKMCARCGKAAYCGPLCQRRHWPEHKRECKQQPTGTATGAREAE